jgi:hypothetical protein
MTKIFLSALLLFLCIPQPGLFSQQIMPAKLGQQENDLNTWDAGDVKEGVVLKHDFVLKNESNAVLNIKDVHTSCGCTVSSAKKKELAPGESTSIEVKVNTKGDSGNIKQLVYVHTDNLDNPVIKYIIKAKVIRQLSNSQSASPN